MNWRDDFLETPAFDLIAQALARDAEARLLGTTVSHYRIEARLGSGGMGIVYRATDTRLERPVALKFLPLTSPRTGGGIAHARFEREARLAAALNHPNICTVYEVGEHDHRPFIAMELLEGQTLKARLTAAPLSPQDIIAIATQVADGLDAAHATGIAHRDVKPGNIFITRRGVVKVLDFGLATVVATETGDAEFGTLPYMSPEHILNQQVDGRTDIYSLGVVLYEMVARRHPFSGASARELKAAILGAAPTPLEGLLGGVIARCLEKEPAARFRSAGELRAALQGLQRHMHDGRRRETTFVFADLERRVLERWARHVPRRIRSNHFTALGMVGAVGAGIAYALSRSNPTWLWLASVMLGVHWLGDSLDGTLARVRGTQRPKYGYYLDHVMGALSVVVIGLGIGLSGYVSLSLALGLVVAYLALAVNVYLESSAFGVVKVEYGRIGPTEVRLLLVVLNTVLALGARPPTRVANWALAILLAGMLAVFSWRLGRNLSRLAKAEPQRLKWWESGKGR